jgi:predicted O-methyltransferase YrrM
LSEGYEFTNDWFAPHAGVWARILQAYPPTRILEIGSYEGRSACFLVDTLAAERPIELHCVDTWQGGVDNDPAVMAEVERRFDANLAAARAKAAQPVDFTKHKSLSHQALARLLVQGRAGTFDLVYVDGSHQAPDVLTDATMAFLLLRVGGVMIFDDYLWSMEGLGRQNHYNMPKPAVDAFVNLFQRKLSVIAAPLYQFYVRKVAD